MAAKGDATRERIVDHALRSATQSGLEGLSIGGLATELGLSKSGLFAHFGSKEDLQIAVLTEGAARFTKSVLEPAFRAPRGAPRLRAIVELWMRWIADPELPGGCIFMAAAVELDDREGRVRDYLVATEEQLHGALAKAARLGVEAGHFRKSVDCDQFAFELYGVMLAFNHAKRLLRDRRAGERAHAAFDRLFAWAEAAHR